MFKPSENFSNFFEYLSFQFVNDFHHQTAYFHGISKISNFCQEVHVRLQKWHLAVLTGVPES